MGNKICIGLYDTDREYMEKFNEYLGVNNNDIFLFVTFSELSKLNKFYGKIDILIVAEKCLNDNIDIIENVIVLVLSDSDNYISIDNYKVIYKYQRTDILISNVLDSVSEIMSNNKENYIRDKKISIIGIYSPISRCGKTMLSVELARRFGSKRALIINFEEFSAIMEYLEIEAEINISDLLFFILNKSGSFDLKLEAAIKSNKGVNVIPPVINVEDIANTDINVWIKLLNKIKDVSKYEIIILDISNKIEFGNSICNICNYILLPFINDTISLTKIDKFYSIINKVLEDSNINKIIKLDMTEVLESGYDNILNIISERMGESILC